VPSAARIFAEIALRLDETPLGGGLVVAFVRPVGEPLISTLENSAVCAQREHSAREAG